MTEKEKWCLEYSERYNKKGSWDFYCISKDAWLNGFQKAKEVILLNEVSRPDGDGYYEDVIPVWMAKTVGEELTEYKIDNNQIGHSSLSSKEKLKQDLLLHFGCKDVMIHVSDNGIVSFQGTFKDE